MNTLITILVVFSVVLGLWMYVRSLFIGDDDDPLD